MQTHTKDFDLSIVIGRFQPLHVGHCSVIESAIEKSGHTLVMVGSSNGSISIQNPWSVEDRIEMIERTFSQKIELGELSCTGIPDSPYREGSWVARVKRMVKDKQTELAKSGKKYERVALVGHFKDTSSSYLALFPEWVLVEAPNYKGLNATDIRYAMFNGNQDGWKLNIPDQVKNYVDTWQQTPIYTELTREFNYIQNYKAGYAMLPYPPIFVTVDALVVQSDKILLINRKDSPGKGLWALPGGFLNADEPLADAVIREVEEETGIRLPKPRTPPVVFDAPNRSSRGRTITHAYIFELPPELKVIPVAGDDAKSAEWVPLEYVRNNSRAMFEDHWHIIDKLVYV